MSVERPHGVGADGDRPLPVTLFGHAQQPEVEIDVVEAEAEDLAAAGTCVHEDPQDRLVTSVGRRPVALADVQEAA